MGHFSKSAQLGKDTRAAFLEAFSRLHDRDLALIEIGRTEAWLYKNTARWKDFKAAYQAMKSRGRRAPGENTIGDHSVQWDGSFGDFRAVFLNRESPWFHLRLSDEIDKVEGGDIMLVIWPPEHGKTSFFEDRCTKDIAIDPDIRITVGKARIQFASLVVNTVKNRLAPEMHEFWKLRERFGPFAPMGGLNAAGQTQIWRQDAFNVFKRRLGMERDYNMQALGFNGEVAGTRCDRLLIDDAQSRKTLSQTDKIVETMRDDWFSRPGITGSTAILMNVVGDGDIAEVLIREDVCDHVTILKAYDETYLELGPRPTKDGDGYEVSPWLWPERYSPDDYRRLQRNAGPEGWARKYQQDWRPAVNRTFTAEMWGRCTNEMRKISHPPPGHPSGREGEIACSLDPGFGRCAVGAAAFEPTRMVVLDSYAKRRPNTTGEMIDMLADEVRHWHRPGIANVKWVVVETKGMQKGIVTDDAFLELQAEIGFEVLMQETGWDKHDDDFGIAQMGRSMDRGEIDIPAGDDESVHRFEGLKREMLDWRPEIKASNRGNKRVQDELMALWFNWTRWHKLRRRSIRRGADASDFGFGGIPLLPGQRVVGPPQSDVSGWNFGALTMRR